jgi:hypothetical protein
MGRNEDRYRSVRQSHIGDALEDLQARGLIHEWRLAFGHPARRTQREIDRGATALAIWTISDGTGRRRYETREAEQYILGRCLENGIGWAPVPQPGGVEAARPVREQLARRAAGGADVLAHAKIVKHLP